MLVIGLDTIWRFDMAETIARLLRDAADEAEAAGRDLLMDEVSKRTRISIDTLRYWRMRGEGPPSYRLGRRVRYPERELLEWLRERKAADAASRQPTPAA
jgi:predicted DNA-binding transcriptional regulator AlpA